MPTKWQKKFLLIVECRRGGTFKNVPKIEIYSGYYEAVDKWLMSCIAVEAGIDRRIVR